MTMRSPFSTFSGKLVSADAFKMPRPKKAVKRVLDNIVL